MLPEASLPKQLAAHQSEAVLARHMMYGGYPEAWQSSDPESTLRSLLEAFVIRDASDLFRVHNLDAFRRLLGLIAGQVGRLVNISEWAQNCGVTRETVLSYLDILRESHIVFLVRPFAEGRRAELVRQPKVYFCDNGLRNMVLQRFAPLTEQDDRGAVLENWVAAELNKTFPWILPGPSVQFWRSKANAEVDFVINHPRGILGIDVKSTHLKRKELSRSSRSFIEAYRPSEFVVLNTGIEADDQLGETKIRWLHFRNLEEINVAIDTPK